MKNPRFFTLLIISLTLNLSCSYAQDHSESISRFEIGLDFLNYNRNWQYYNGIYRHVHGFSLEPINGRNFVLEAIPSVYAKIPLNKYSFRLRFEYFQTHYLFNSLYGISRHVDGDFKEGRILSGIEKNIINKRIKVYYLIDFALSVSNYKGLYTYYGGVPHSNGIEQFNINSFGVALQPGLGLTFKVTDKLNLCLESSVLFGIGYDQNDNYNINQGSRLIPRPISLLGFSYIFKRPNKHPADTL
jgi:hypothetical protein